MRKLITRLLRPFSERYHALRVLDLRNWKHAAGFLGIVTAPIPIITFSMRGEFVLYALAAYGIAVVIGLWLLLPSVTRNVAALSRVSVPHPRPDKQMVIKYAKLAHDTFWSGRQKTDKLVVSRDTSLDEILKRYERWFEQSPDSLYLFVEKSASGFSREPFGGFWVIGLTRETFDALHTEYDLNVRKIETIVSPSDPRCYAIQTIGVVGGDTLLQRFFRSFPRSEIVLSHSFTTIRRLCWQNQYIEYWCNTHFPNEKSSMPKINNADKCLVSRSGDRVLHCTKASKLRDECPEYPSATGLKLQRNNAALRSAADAK